MRPLSNSRARVSKNLCISAILLSVSAHAAPPVSSSPASLTEAQKRYLQDKDQRGSVEATPSTTGDPEQELQEIIKRREETAKKMQQLRDSFDPSKPARARASTVRNIGDHPRMLPFLLLEGMWLLAMLLLRAWLAQFTDRKAVSLLASLFVFLLFVAGAGLALPLGVLRGVYRQWLQANFGIAF